MSQRKRANRGKGKNQMTNQRDDDREPIIDLGNPTRMVGHTAFLKNMGGGKCCSCKNYASALMPDGKCARCSGVNDLPAPPRPGKKG